MTSEVNQMANSVVFGIFSTKQQVETAVGEMKRLGFRNSDVSVLFPYSNTAKNLAAEKSTRALAGAAAGGVIGGALGWFAGVGTLGIPGLGLFAAAGPIMALLSGVGVAIGGVTGTLVGMGVPEPTATRYEGLIKSGSILLSVHANDSNGIQKAKTILERTGAGDIAATGDSKGAHANADKLQKSV